MKKRGVQTLLKILAVVIFSTAFFASCKKDRIDKLSTSDTTTNASGTRDQLTADSIFLYAKEVYLWNESLPTYEAFNPRQYVTSDAEAGFNNELFKITRYAINPLTNKPYEYSEDDSTSTKYSYIFNTDNTNPVAYVAPSKASVDLEGNGYDIGVQIGLYLTNQAGTTYGVFVQAVYQNSPAEKAGMSRGDRITSINGKTLNTLVANLDDDYSLLYNTFLADEVSPVTLKGYKRDGSALNVTLTKTSYKSNPIYCDTVYTAGSKKIGYLAYARFSSTANSQSVLDAAFSKFAAGGVTDLIIDLRYNGGGYVETAEHLANLIIPSSKNGQVMFSEHFNSLMQSGKATILAKQPFTDENDKIQYENGKMVTYADLDYSISGNTTKFAKAGSLDNVNNVVFIVTSNTASASELVINSLKPYFPNLKIVGEQSYGKPVGFFPVRIDKYDVYFSMFESWNSTGVAPTYYNGFTPDKEAFDDPEYLLGDLNESSLNTAYTYLQTGSFPASSSVVSSSRSSSTGLRLRRLLDSKKQMPVKGFKGMIETRMHLRK